VYIRNMPIQVNCLINCRGIEQVAMNDLTHEYVEPCTVPATPST
jgi:hypothetical protein